MKWNWLLEGKCIAIGFGLMILLIGGIHQISYRNVTRLSESTDKVAQTHEVLEALMGILASLNKAEAGRYSYILFIPPEALQTLYEPFQRGGNTKGISGTGLGLAVVKKHLDLHQGQIFVESEVGIGTTFTVTIPQATSALTAPAS